MRSIFLTIITLLFTACNPTMVQNATPATNTIETQKVPSNEAQTLSLPTTLQDNDINDLTKIIDETSLDGNYTLKRGMFRNQNIQEGYLVIEEIDANNYGYYYVTITKGYTPETHTGIFYKKGGEFVQKIIEDNTPEEIAQGKPKSKVTIIENIKVTLKNNILKIFIDSNKQEKLIWQRDQLKLHKSETLEKTLEEAKEEYRIYYKNKCQESIRFCGDGEYTKVNE